MKNMQSYAPYAAALATALLAACGSDTSGPPLPDLTITTESLPVAVLDEPYSAGIAAEGGDENYEWDLSQGALPSGLTLEVEDLPANDVVVTGVPQETGTFTFTVRVRSGDGQQASRQLTLEVLSEPAQVTLGNVVLPPALAGGPYDVILRATGGDGESYSFEITSGSLPAGLQLIGGRIQGTPAGTDTTTVTIAVSSGGGTAERTYQLVVVANRTGDYHITPVPVTEIPDAIRPHVTEAIAQWERVIAADRPAVAIPARFFSPDHCGGFGLEINGTSTDDILILMNIESIDGPGDVLARAGPCGLTGDTLPFAGILTLDSDDLLPLVGTNTLTHIIAHEIGHVLGFGSLWTRKNLLTGSGTSNPTFTGSQAIAEYEALGGTGSVPVEGQGGEGTADSHWRETVFDEELMTGFSEPIGVSQPLSRVSVASMADLGYSVDLNAADSYSLGSSLLAPGSVGPDPWDNLGYDIVDVGPVLILEAGGPGPRIQ